jgi:hypothetical protein
MNSTKLSSLLAVIALSWWLLGLAGCNHTASPASQSQNAAATEPAQATFSSPDQASQTLVDALRADDEAKLKSILGSGADQVIFSGDDVADQQNRQEFLDLYDAKHQLSANADGSMTLTVGSDDWPMPVPISKNGDGAWYFDTQAGLDEILDRRIGKNELSAIQVCLAIVDAETDYVEQNPNGDNVPDYAEKILSESGRKDGLYWPTKQGEEPSPLGSLVAAADEEGYNYAAPGAKDAPQPYHGYFYHILTSQGPHAAGGASDYIVDGKMVGGFAVIAYPAQYGNSGIMTFIVNYQGIVYQKDLGENTASIAKGITQFDPDSSWKIAQ